MPDTRSNLETGRRENEKSKELPKIVLLFPGTSTPDAGLLPPLSLVYIATPLKELFDIHIIDQRIDREWQITLKNALTTGDVVCVGISSMTGPQIAAALEAAEMVRQCASDIPLVWGGVHPSLLPEETIQHDLVDILVAGDGEETFAELVTALCTGGDKSLVKGILYKHNGTVCKTPPRERFPLHALGMPAFELLELDRYEVATAWIEKKSLPLVTSRGCPYKCAYCYNTEFSQQKWMALSATETISLIEELNEKYGIEGIFLLDDNFFVNLKRVREICDRLLEQEIHLHFYNANCRVDTLVKMDDDLLKLMKQAGFHQLFVGVESGSDRVLEEIGKGITTAQTVQINAKLARAGIRPFYSFMAGFPSETVDDITMTVRLMRRLLRDNPEAIVYKLQLFTPFPGTKLFHQALRLGMNAPNSLEGWARYHYDNIHYNGFSASHKKFLEAMHYYTTFLDKKLRASHSLFRRMIAAMYSGILKFRIDHGFYAFLYEQYPMKIGRAFRSKFKELTASRIKQ